MAEQVAADRRITLCRGKNHDTNEFARIRCELGVKLRIAADIEHKGSTAIEVNASRHRGYAVSQK